MAVFRLILKIKSEGQEVFPQAAEDVKKLNQELEKTSGASFANVEEQTEKIGKNVENISKSFSNVIKSIIQQTTGALSQSVDTIAQEGGKSFETLLSRVALGTGTVASLWVLQIDQIFNTARVTSTGFFSLLKNFSTGFFEEVSTRSVGLLNFFSSRISSISGLIDNMAFGFGSIFGSLQKSFPFASGLNQAFSNLAFAMGPITKGLGTLLGGAGTFFAINIALKETTFLFRRFIGQGSQAVTPLERISNIITVIDDSFRGMELRAGSVLKTVGLFAGAAAAFQAGPLFGIATTLSGVNSLISNIMQVGLRRRLEVLSFFGSAKAQLGLIFLDLKRIATEGLPGIERNAKAVNTIEANAKKADVALKRVGGNLESITQLQAQSRARFTLGEQFQLFALEIKIFLPKLIAEINRVFNLLTAKFGVTQNELKAIDKTANLTAVAALKDVTNLTSGVEGVFKKSREGASIFKTIGLSIRNSLADSITAPGKNFKKFFEDFRKDSEYVSTRNTIGEAFKAQFKGLEATSKDAAQKTKKTIKETFKTPVNFNFGTKVLEEVKVAVNQVNESIKNTVKDSAEIPRNFLEFKNIAAQIPEALKALPSAVREIEKATKEVTGSANKSITEIRDNIQSILSNVLNPEKFKAIGKGLKVSERGRPQQFAAFFDEMKKFGEGNGDIEKFSSKIGVLERTVRDVSKLIGGEAVEEFKKFQNEMKRAGELKPPLNPEVFKRGFSELEKLLMEGAKKLGKDANNMGQAFSIQLTEALTSGKTTAEFEKALLIIAGLMGDFFPHSPAKRGPLKELPKMGLAIAKQLGDGMQGGKKDVAAGAETLAKQIAGYFPQSPALFGPLKFLFQSGLKIGQILADGIRSSLGIIKDAANFIATELSATIGRAVNLDFLSQRVGISVEVLSSFNNALASVNASVTDLEFSLNSANKSLANTLDPEKAKQFKSLGIDVNEVKAAVNPSIELLLKVSDIIQGLPPSSKKFQEALELIGVTSGSSPLIPFLLKGREEIIKLQKEGVLLGTTFDKELTKSALAFNEIVNKAKLVRETIFNTFAKEVLPTLVDFGNKLLEIIQANSTKIKAFFSILGQSLAVALQALAEFIQFAVNNPSKALDLVFNLFKGFVNLTRNLFDSLFTFLEDKLLNFLSRIGQLLIEIPKQILIFVFSAIRDQIEFQLTKLMFGLEVQIKSTISDLVKELKPGVRSFLGLDKFIFTDEEIAKSQSKLDKIEGKLLGFGDAIAGAIDTAKNNIKDKIPAVQDALENVLNNNLKETIKQDFVDFVNDIAKATENTPLESLGEKFKKIFSIENIEEEIAKIEQLKTAQISAIEEVSAAQSGQASASVPDASSGNMWGYYDGLKKQQDAFYADYDKKVEEEKKKEEEKNLAKIGMAKDYAGKVGDITTGLNELLGKKSKELFYVQKAMSIVQATINIAEGITKAIAQGGIAGIATGALVAAAGAIQIATIAKSEPKFARGGFLEGPRHSQGGIPVVNSKGTPVAEAEGGEFFVQRKATQYYPRSFLNAINETKISKEAAMALAVEAIPSASGLKFEGGGSLQTRLPETSASGMNGQKESINIYNVPDQSLFDNYLASTPGIRRVMNLLRNNREEVKQIVF